MKKKIIVSSKDKQDWTDFINEPLHIYDKDSEFTKQNYQINKVRKLDLHGFSIIDANQLVKKFIIDSSESGYKKLLIITGKGLRSKVYDDPYVSQKINTLKYSVPEYIKNDKGLLEKISKIYLAPPNDGGDGAFYILLKKNNL